MDATLTAPPVPRACPGSFPRRTETYPSLLDLCVADPDRTGSTERDVGLGWSSRGRLFRCALVMATREVYLCQLEPSVRPKFRVRFRGSPR